jgi:hypothetical protein
MSTRGHPVDFEGKERMHPMFRTKTPKLLVVTAFAVAVLGATPLAEAGLGIPQGPSANAAATATPRLARPSLT